MSAVSSTWSMAARDLETMSQQVSYLCPLPLPRYAVAKHSSWGREKEKICSGLGSTVIQKQTEAGQTLWEAPTPSPLQGGLGPGLCFPWPLALLCFFITFLGKCYLNRTLVNDLLGDERLSQSVFCPKCGWGNQGSFITAGSHRHF